MRAIAVDVDDDDDDDDARLQRTRDAKPRQSRRMRHCSLALGDRETHCIKSNMRFLLNGHINTVIIQAYEWGD